MALNIGINWRIGGGYGWGVFGVNLALELLRGGKHGVVLLQTPGQCDQNPLRMMQLSEALRNERELAALLKEKKFGTLKVDATVIHPAMFDFEPFGSNRFKGSRNACMIFFENTTFSKLGLERARSYERVLVGSKWNHTVLKERGLGNVRLAHQGIDLSRFHPAPRIGLFKDQFVIFAGGKLEYRKGQDIVLKAFKIFNQRRPNSILVTNWQNLFPDLGVHITAGGLVDNEPEKFNNGNGLDINKWMVRCGLPEKSFIDCGLVSNSELPAIIREADVTVAASRCEGGTNLVAMESMACGIPTILSANTGHLDLIDDDNCYVLKHQSSSTPVGALAGTEGWGNSDVEELVEKLEEAYQDRLGASERGIAAAHFMKSWSWADKVNNLLRQLPFA